MNDNYTLLIKYEDTSTLLNKMEAPVRTMDSDSAAAEAPNREIFQKDWDYSSHVDIWNWLNADRLNEYKNVFNKRLLTLIRESAFEFGYDSPADEFLRDWFRESTLAIKDDYSSQVSNENRLNADRLNEYKNIFNKRFLALIRESEFEFGYDSPADEFLRDRFRENALVTKEWVNKLFIENFSNIHVATGILRVIAHFDYQKFHPQGPTIALAALSHCSAEVRECGIRALENWGTSECLDILKKVSCPEPWMQQYVSQVIIDLEETLYVRAS